MAARLIVVRRFRGEVSVGLAAAGLLLIRRSTAIGNVRKCLRCLYQSIIFTMWPALILSTCALTNSAAAAQSLWPLHGRHNVLATREIAPSTSQKLQRALCC